MAPNDDRGEVGGIRRALADAGPYLEIGSSLAATVLLSLWAGHALDRKFGTEPRYFLMGAVFGLVAAIYHFYRMYKTLTGTKR